MLHEYNHFWYFPTYYALCTINKYEHFDNIGNQYKSLTFEPTATPIYFYL